VTDEPPRPPRPDPFAPLPLADLPPVRRRGPPDPSEPASTRSRRASERPGTPDTPDTRTPDTRTPDTRTPDTQSSAPTIAMQPTESDSKSWTDMPGPPDAPEAQSVAPITGTQPTETSGSMSWTDLPGTLGAPGAPGAPITGPQPTEASGSMSWTDLPAQPMSGQPMSGQPISGQPISGQPMSGQPDAAEGPLLPSTVSENDLRAAVGATQLPQSMPGAASAAKKSRRRAPTDDDDDGDDDEGDGPSKPRNRKMMLVGALTLAVGGAIAAMVIIGKINSQRYLITCEADRVVVEHGRTFPPWGESTLDGAEWKALKIPPEAPCAPYETESKAELAAHYLDILKDHATTLLTAREVTKIDDAEAQLKQALLVARSLGRDDERMDARNEIERLLGDVGYWRASAKLRSASDALTEAANDFEVAAKQRPRHVTDAAAWALYVRKLVEQLRAGPAGAAQGTFPPLPPGERPSVPPGVALPIEPGTGSGSAGSAAEPEMPPSGPAGPPTGGVLL